MTMPVGEQIVLDDDGEGEGEESDPVLAEEAGVCDNPSHSANPSSFSNSTAAPGGFAGGGAPVQGARPRKISRPRTDMVVKIHRELGRVQLYVTQATEDHIKEAMRLMETADAGGDLSWGKNITSWEAWLAQEEQEKRALHFVGSMLPPGVPPGHLSDVVPPGAMQRAGAQVGQSYPAQSLKDFNEECLWGATGGRQGGRNPK